MVFLQAHVKVSLFALHFVWLGGSTWRMDAAWGFNIPAGICFWFLESFDTVLQFEEMPNCAWKSQIWGVGPFGTGRWPSGGKCLRLAQCGWFSTISRCDENIFENWTLQNPGPRSIRTMPRLSWKKTISWPRFPLFPCNGWSALSSCQLMSTARCGKERKKIGQTSSRSRAILAAESESAICHRDAKSNKKSRDTFLAKKLTPKNGPKISTS